MAGAFYFKMVTMYTYTYRQIRVDTQYLRQVITGWYPEIEGVRI